MLSLMLVLPVGLAAPAEAHAGELEAGSPSAQVVKSTHAKKAKKPKKVFIGKAKAADVKSRVYTGKEIKPAVKLTYKGRKLKKDRDYTLEYSSNVNVGTAKIVIRGAQRFKGKKVIKFDIVKAEISKAKVAKIASKYTTGLSAVKPAPEVTRFGLPLKKGRDYTVAYRNNVMPGKAIATIKGKGNYTGSAVVTFKLINMGDSLARKACKLSYSQESLVSDGFKGTNSYLSAYEKYKAKGVWTPISCSVGMHIAIRAAKYDADFTINTEKDCKYLNFWSDEPGNDKWACLGYFYSDMELLPGDILLGDKKKGVNHIFMYVGDDIAQKVYKTNLKGTDADRGSPAGPWVSSHVRYRGGSALCMCDWRRASSGHKSFKVFRCIDPDCR